MARGHEFNGYVFINANEEQDLHLEDSEFALGQCGDCACDDMCEYDYEEDEEDAMKVPVLRSYQESPSAGKNLTGQLKIVKEDLLNFEAGGLRITDWNADKQDGADIYDITPPVELRADNLKANLTNEPEDDVCTDIAEALDSEIQRLRTQWGNGADTKLNAAVNEALYRTQNPTTNLDGVFKLKKFVVGAGQAILGLGTNMAGRKFSYNHGATIIFNPFRVRVTKTGKSKIKCTITNRDKSEVVICAKGFIFYSTRSNGGDASLPLSFFFRPDDTYTSAGATAIKNEIMSAFRPLPEQNCSAATINDTVLAAFNSLTKGTGWTQSAILTDGEGIKVRAQLAPPADGTAGVFKIRFSFTFGEQNGSLTIGNMFISFLFDVKNYNANVNTVQQYKARVREYAAKYQAAMAARALALANANASAGGGPATTPGTNLTIPPNSTGSNNYAERPHSLPSLPPDISATVPPTEIPPTLTNPSNGTNTNETATEALPAI
jgi:hypothetical protein